MFRTRTLGLLVIIVFTLAGCGQSAPATPTPTRQLAVSPTSASSPTRAPSPSASPAATPGPAGTPTTDTSPSLTPGAIPPEAEELVEQSREAVAQERGVPTSQVKVVSVQMVEWSDTSLGCPEPGMSYAQVITPGYLVQLSVGGQTFEYHTDREGTVITCPNPQPPALIAQ